MPSTFFFPLINHRWWVILNSEFRRMATQFPIVYQVDPDRDGPYLIRLGMVVARYCVFVWIIREPRVNKTEWSGLEGKPVPVVWISANTNGRIAVSEILTPPTPPFSSCGSTASFLIL
jgi:hypothetical protein